MSRTSKLHDRMIHRLVVLGDEIYCDASRPASRHPVDGPDTVAYSSDVLFSRRHIRSTLRAVIPLLALVWASLPLHHCNLVSAAPISAPVPGDSGSLESGDRFRIDCGHQSPDSLRPAKSAMPCNDLGRAGPDLRPTVAIDGGLVHVSFDSSWLDRASDSGWRQALTRPLDDGRWRLRPLHLQKSVLLI